MNGLTQDDLTQGGGHRDSWEDSAGAPAEQGSIAWLLGVTYHDGPEERLVRLVRTIEAEIIPRLMLTHRTVPGSSPIPADDGGTPGSAEDVAEFARLVLAHDVIVASSYVEAMRAQGMSLETLYLDLLTPAARRIGDLWEADLCDYTEVALGLWRLQQVLRELSPAFASETACRSRGQKALLVSAPGEQHVLGTFMVSEFFRCVASEFFRRAGWDVWGAPPASREQMLDILRVERFDVVNISVSCGGRLDVLAEDIISIREASRNRSIRVMVGGPVFIDHPEFVELIGADAMAVDAREAVVRAESLLVSRE